MDRLENASLERRDQRACAATDRLASASGDDRRANMLIIEDISFAVNGKLAKPSG